MSTRRQAMRTLTVVGISPALAACADTRRTDQVVWVVGDVVSPGEYSFNGGASFDAMVSAAGGFLRDGVRKRRIMRDGKILDATPGQSVEAGDVLLIAHEWYF